MELGIGWQDGQREVFCFPMSFTIEARLRDSLESLRMEALAPEPSFLRCWKAFRADAHVPIQCCAGN